jgi:hypothetical protein
MGSMAGERSNADVAQSHVVLRAYDVVVDGHAAGPWLNAIFH